MTHTNPAEISCHDAVRDDGTTVPPMATLTITHPRSGRPGSRVTGAPAALLALATNAVLTDGPVPRGVADKARYAAVGARTAAHSGRYVLGDVRIEMDGMPEYEPADDPRMPAGA